MSNRMIWVLCFAVLLPVMGCYTPRKGRDCRLFDTRTSYLDTKFSLTAESSSDAQTHQLLSDFGCIAIKTHVTAYDRIDCVRIYEIADWSKSEVGMEERDAFLISDPPQVDYPGVTNRELPSSIPASVRKPSGVQRSDLPASRFPVRVQWQVVISDDDEWIEDENDFGIVLSGAEDVRDEQEKEVKISLCRDQLEKLIAIPRREFRVLFRLSPLGWTDASKRAEPMVLFLRERLTREMVERELARGPRS